MKAGLTPSEPKEEAPDPGATPGEPLEALLEGATVVDVRSPGEFAKGAVAGAVNLPLFSDGERSEIGILYKLLGKEKAIHKGLDLFGARLSDYIASFEPFRKTRLLVYCARGGMRSSAVTGLLSAFGFDARQLPGGYKGFRAHLLSVFEHGLPPWPVVIHGQTGTGKTQILNRLPNALDLEDCARHRSSVFGAINLEPRTQQQFDAHLLAALGRLDHRRPVWVEGESRKIGAVTMPETLRAVMREAPCVLVTGSLEVRVGRIVEEYAATDEATHRQWEEALRSLTSALGKAKVKDMISRVRKNEFHPVVETLLVDYYDPKYRHSMSDYQYALTVSSDNLDEAVAALRGFSESMARESMAEAGKQRHSAKTTGNAGALQR